MKKRVPKKMPPSVIQAPALTPEEGQELDYDVCCCIEEIETILSKNCTEKQKKLGEISLKILRNPGESVIKKKQVMRQWFGDYKKKFENKKKQLSVSLNEKKCAFVDSETSFKSVCYRKHESQKPEASNDFKNSSDFNKDDEKTISGCKDTENSFKFQF